MVSEHKTNPRYTGFVNGNNTHLDIRLVRQNLCINFTVCSTLRRHTLKDFAKAMNHRYSSHGVTNLSGKKKLATLFVSILSGCMKILVLKLQIDT